MYAKAEKKQFVPVSSNSSSVSTSLVVPLYLVHAVLLHSKFSSISMRGLGHGLQLLLLQAGVLCRHRLTQPVDTVPRKDRVRRHILGLSTLYLIPK